MIVNVTLDISEAYVLLAEKLQAKMMGTVGDITITSYDKPVIRIETESDGRVMLDTNAVRHEIKL